MLDNVFTRDVTRVHVGGTVSFANDGDTIHNAFDVDGAWSTAAAGHDAHGLSLYDAAAPGGAWFPLVGGAPGTARAATYGHGAQPPLRLSSSALDHLTHPRPI